VAGFDGGDGLVGEFVAALVVGVAGVAFDPVPVDFVMRGGEEAGSKLDKATKLGVKILNEGEFRAML
jgi:BRCT domain type II-containing protein